MKYNQENSENGGAISPSFANPYCTSHWNVGCTIPTAILQQPPETPPIIVSTPKRHIPTKKQLTTPSLAPF